MNRMEVALVWLVVFVLHSFLTSGANADGGKDSHEDRQLQNAEYCQLEAFHPRCWKNEIIAMENAFYGRMEVGKCIEAEDALAAYGSDPRYLGCSVDVLGVLDRKCSGKASCDVSVTDSDLEVTTRPCYKGLFMYLKVAYRCIAVIESDRSCLVPVTSQVQHLTSLHNTIGCGSRHQPWILESQSGQRVSLDLVRFSRRAATEGDHEGVKPLDETSKCGGEVQYGYVLDKTMKKNISICSSGEVSKRKEHLHTSGGNVVEIVLTQELESSTDAGTDNILIRFQAVGCSDLIPPEDAWLKRTDDQAVIGCFSSRQTWLLKCEDQQWIGVLGNCSMVSVAESLQNEDDGHRQDYQLLSIVAIGGFGVAICLLIICIGFLCARRYSSNNKSTERLCPEKQPIESNTGRSQQLIYRPLDGMDASIGPTYAVYAGGSENTRHNGTFNGLIQANNFGSENVRNIGSAYAGSMQLRNDNSSAYFVLDPEAVAGEP